MSTAVFSTSPKAPTFDPAQVEPVVEMSLLLPNDWAQRLHDRARQQQITVGCLLRDLIGQALTTSA